MTKALVGGRRWGMSRDEAVKRRAEEEELWKALEDAYSIEDAEGVCRVAAGRFKERREVVETKRGTLEHIAGVLVRRWRRGHMSPEDVQALGGLIDLLEGALKGGDYERGSD